MQPEPTLRARSCPTCHSIGEPYVIDRTLGSNEPIRCKNLWHIEVREPERAGRFEECCRGLTDGWCALPIGHAGSCDPTVEARDTHFWTKIAALTAERDEARDLVRRYEGTGDDSKLTYAELEQERDRLALDLYRAQDCGHDLDAFGRHADELAEAREQAARWMHEATRQAAERDANYAEVQRLSADLASLAHWWCPNCEAIPPSVVDDDMCARCGNQAEWAEADTLTSVKAYAEKVKQARDEAWAERDRLAELVRWWEPVIEAAKAWVRAAQESPTFQTVGTFGAGKALLALKDAAAALGDAPDPDEFQPMFGKVSEEDMRLVARATGGGIRSADLKVEFEDESDGSSTADPTSPTESGQRGRDADARCSKCGNPLTPCVTCGKPAGCGDSWCADCVPDAPAGTETGDDRG